MSLFSKFSLFIILAVSLFVACKKDQKTSAPLNNSQGTQTFGDYPFEVGREWHYSTKLITYLSDTTEDDYIMVYKHIKDTILFGIPCFKIEVSNTNILDTLQVWKSYRYYANRQNGLYFVAEDGNAGGFTMFKNANSENKVIELLFPELSVEKVDSIIQLDSTLQLTKLPVVFGEVWTYGSQSNTKRRWLGLDNVTVPIGSFACYKLQHIIGTGNPNNFKIYQYFSQKGLTMVDIRQDSITSSTGYVGYLTAHSELIYTNF